MSVSLTKTETMPSQALGQSVRLPGAHGGALVTNVREISKHGRPGAYLLSITRGYERSTITVAASLSLPVIAPVVL